MTDRIVLNPGSPERAALDHAAGLVAGLLRDVFAHIDRMVERVQAEHRTVRAGGRGLASTDLRVLRELITRRLLDDDGLLAGTGAIFGPGALTDTAEWLEWWYRTPNGAISLLEVDLNPDSERFYDFTSADWFSGPQQSGGRSVVGPYVDYGGTDVYMVTLTSPIFIDGRFLGVAGADLPMKELEHAVLPRLCAIDRPAALVNADRRVILSTSGNWIAGSLLRGPAGALATVPCGSTPWSIALPTGDAVPA